MEMEKQENLHLAKSGGLEQLLEQPNHKHNDVKSTKTWAKKTMMAAGVLNIVSGTTFLAMAFFDMNVGIMMLMLPGESDRKG